MSTAAIHECEVLARKVAIWSSLAAAVVFGVGFATDRALSYHLVIGQAEQIGLVLLVFAGYWFAWSTRFEAPGWCSRLGRHRGLLDMVPHAKSRQSAIDLPGGGSAGAISPGGGRSP